MFKLMLWFTEVHNRVFLTTYTKWYNLWILNVLYILCWQKDTVVAEETRRSVQAEEAKASEKARFAGAIAADAQRDLDEALPALDAALTSLKSLNKNDVTEVRDFDDD